MPQVDFYVTPVVCSIQDVLTKESLRESYPTVFTGLCLLCDNHQPVINPARRIPHSLKDRLQQTLERNVTSGVLKKVDEPTDWVSNLVVVEKKDGSLRLCLDPKDLNRAIKREHYTIPTLQEIVTEFAGNTVFSTLHLKDGYWQIQENSHLCTFSTPYGRNRFTRMPFGIKSASEVFQKKNEQAFSGIPGVHIVADDIIIAAKNKTIS